MRERRRSAKRSVGKSIPDLDKTRKPRFNPAAPGIWGRRKQTPHKQTHGWGGRKGGREKPKRYHNVPVCKQVSCWGLMEGEGAGKKQDKRENSGKPAPKKKVRTMEVKPSHHAQNDRQEAGGSKKSKRRTGRPVGLGRQKEKTQDVQPGLPPRQSGPRNSGRAKNAQSTRRKGQESDGECKKHLARSGKNGVNGKRDTKVMKSWLEEVRGDM